jgi:hypothetical protein
VFVQVCHLQKKIKRQKKKMKAREKFNLSAEKLKFRTTKHHLHFIILSRVGIFVRGL